MSTHFALAIGLSLILPSELLAQTDSTKDADTLLERMAEAHGGKGAWLNAPALKFTFAMHLTSLQPSDNRTWSDSWRYYETTLDPDTSRTYINVPFEEKDGFEAGFDGQNLWQTELTFDPSFQDNAMMLSWFHSSMVGLPFLASVEGASAQYLGQETLLDGDVSYDVVQVSYADLGWGGDFDLFLDQSTGRLKAWRQGAMTPPLPGAPVPGLPTPPAKVLRVIDSYVTKGGLTLPRQYVSYSPAGDLGGVHMLLDFEQLGSFNEQAARPPERSRVIYSKDG